MTELKWQSTINTTGVAGKIEIKVKSVISGNWNRGSGNGKCRGYLVRNSFESDSIKFSQVMFDRW